MIMTKRALILTILIAVLVILPICVSCQSNGDDDFELVLSSDDVEAVYTPLLNYYTLNVTRDKNASHYAVAVYPMGDMSHCIFSENINPLPTSKVVKIELDSDVIVWQYLDVYIVAYSDDYLVSSNVLKYTIACLVYDTDIHIAEEQEAGVIEGYDEPGYYYVPLLSRLTIVKATEETTKYAFVAETQNIDSIEMPLMYDGCYTINNDLGAVVVEPDCINPLETGSLINMKVKYKDGTESETQIAIVDALTPKLGNASVERGYAADVTFDCLKSDTNWKFAKVTFDGKILQNSAYKTNKTNVIIYATFLNTLPLGDHELRIYYSCESVIVGCSKTTITVDESKSKAPYNLQLSIDNTYPNVQATWDVDYDYSEAIIYVNDVAQVSSLKQAAVFNEKSAILYGLNLKKTDKVEVLIKYDNGSTFKSQEAYLDYSLSDHNGKESYFTNKFYYIGRECNGYIVSEQELYDYIGYKINHYSDNDHIRYSQWEGSETYTIYSPYLVAKYQTNEDLKTAINKGYEVFIEPLAYNISSVTHDGNVITFTVTMYSGSTRPYENRVTAYDSITKKYEEYQYSELHYYTNGESQRSSTYDDFKVNSRAKSATVETSLELALALEDGYKPLPVSGSNAYKVYNMAKSVLREIIDDRMTDYEKVLAIYDWLSYNVIYDRGLDNKVNTLSSGTAEYRALYKNPSFYAEGVFFYGIAVCNGIGSAFSILANIEGIPAIKTMGKVGENGSHTWVKVYVNDEWYICDATWSNAVEYTDEGNNLEYITYDFFMLSADEAKYNNRREFTDKPANDYYCGDTNLDYFASSTFAYNGKLHTKFVKNIASFEDLLDYYIDSLSPGETIQFSIKMEKKNSILSINASSVTAKKWLDEYYTTPTGVTITVFARSNAAGTVISDFNNIVYIRISKA